jgi:RimJ/RimL family protein N-acetyltransferase
MPHNAHSPHHRKAWGGLVAVAPSQRGKKLGNYVNAAIVDAAFNKLNADGIYELVSSTNTPSRRMVEACGVQLDPSLLSGAATPSDARKFTT